MQNIWFSSDFHWGHKNIVRGTTEWDAGDSDKVRNFDTVEEHNEQLIHNINSVVKYDHTLYYLGDWSFGGHENIKKFRDQLHCRDIRFFFGNHDQHIEPIDSPYRKLFTSCDYYGELNLKIDSQKTGQYGKQKIVMSHYAMRVWNKSHHGSIMLFGHSHGNLKGYEEYKTMDVGCDTHNLYPYHLDEIIDIMKGRKVLLEVDHHAKHTN